MSRFKRPKSKKKSGDWIVYDDVSGIDYMASEMVIDYKGRAVKRGTEDKQHPQELPLPVIREAQPPYVRPEPTPVYTDVNENPFQDVIDDFYEFNIDSDQSNGDL